MLKNVLIVALSIFGVVVLWAFLSAVFRIPLLPFGVKSVSIVLPNHYRGKFIFHEDKVSGVDPPVREGSYYIEVPRNGKVSLKSMDFFERWMSYEFTYMNGLRLESLDPGKVSGQVYIFSLGRKSVSESAEHRQEDDGDVSYFVGTREEYADFGKGTW